MSYEPSPAGRSTGEPNSQPGFVGNLAMVLLVIAVLFALIVLIASVTHPAVY
jgi:hypothetical protein